MLVRTRDSGEFFLNKAGKMQLNEFRQKVSLAEIDEELKDPDFWLQISKSNNIHTLTQNQIY